MRIGKSVFRNALAKSITADTGVKTGSYYGVHYTIFKSADGSYYAKVKEYGFPSTEGHKTKGAAEKKIVRLIRKVNQERDPYTEFLL